MADKQAEKPQRARGQEPLRTVEELMAATGTAPEWHACACARRGWAVGKQVTEAAYRAAVRESMEAPLDG